MTANVLPKQTEAYRAAGMDGHVGKPLDRSELLAMVARLLPPGRDVGETVLRPNLDGHIYLSDAENPLHRRCAHMLSASSAMLGFTALSVACREVEGFDEAKVEREGVGAFAASLTEAGGLAAKARGTVEDLFHKVGRRQSERRG